MLDSMKFRFSYVCRVALLFMITVLAWSTLLFPDFKHFRNKKLRLDNFRQLIGILSSLVKILPKEEICILHC